MTYWSQRSLAQAPPETWLGRPKPFYLKMEIVPLSLHEEVRRRKTEGDVTEKMDRLVKAYVTGEEADALKMAAKERGISVSQFVAGLIRENISKPERTESGEAEPEETGWIKVRIPASEKQKIREMADSKGISIQEYVRQALHRRSIVDVNIAVHDLRDYVAATDRLMQTVNGILAVITRSGRVYQQDVEKIKELMGEIADKTAEMYRMEVSDRRQLYNEARKKVYEEINVGKIAKHKRRGLWHSSRTH